MLYETQNRIQMSRLVTKVNALGIPVGTQLHFSSFVNRPQPNNPSLWESITYYAYEDEGGELHIVPEKQISAIYDSTINVIRVENCKLVKQGEPYWKIIVQERECQFHKLEYNGKGHEPAIPFKIYKDTVYDNTGDYKIGIRMFASLEDAEACLEAMKKAALKQAFHSTKIFER